MRRSRELPDVQAFFAEDVQGAACIAAPRGA
jgi:hypothetical protein